MKLMEQEKEIYKDKAAALDESMSKIELKYSNSMQIERLIKGIMKKESKSYDNKKSSQKAQPTVSKGGCGCGCNSASEMEEIDEISISK